MQKPNGVPILIRRTHEERILAVLRDNGPLPRSEIEARVGLSRTTVSEITGNLLSRGALVETDAAHASRGRGRPAIRLALDPVAGQFLGVDFGHRRVFAAVVNASNEIIGSGTSEYAEGTTWSERIEIAFALLLQIEDGSGVRFGALEGVGIGVPGPVSSVQLGALSRISTQRREAAEPGAMELVQRSFSARFDAPILVDNNTRFAGLAEAVWGPDEDVDSLLYVRLSDGVGGGLVVGGRLIAGSFGMAGEIGHVSVEGGSLECWCGKAGCLETVASIPSILRAVQVRRPDITDFAGVIDALDSPTVRSAVVAAGHALGVVLGAVSTVIDPREVVVAGDVLRLGPLFFHSVLESFDSSMVRTQLRDTRLRQSNLGEEAGALGAIAAAFHRSPLLAGYPTLARPDSVTDRVDTNRAMTGHREGAHT